jgi:hypothetical protein
MKNTLIIGSTFALTLLTFSSFVKQPVNGFNKDPESANMGDTIKKVVEPLNNFTTYFGCSDTVHTITKAKFLGLIDKPICVRDKQNKQYPVQSFRITYAERGLYLDSNDAPIIINDYSEENFKGDSITAAWKGLFQSRLFKGDTITFEKVSIAKDGKTFRSKNLKMAVVE